MESEALALEDCSSGPEGALSEALSSIPSSTQPPLSSSIPSSTQLTLSSSAVWLTLFFSVWPALSSVWVALSSSAVWLELSSVWVALSSSALHYLDHFLLLGRPGTQQCETALHTAKETLGQLGVPIAAYKREGPATALTFLGIHIDTVNMSLSLAADKLAHDSVMARQKNSDQTATSILDQPPQSCCIRGSSWAGVHQENDRPDKGGKGARPPHTSNS